MIAVLLAALGLLLSGEAFIDTEPASLIVSGIALRTAVGLGVGVVSSMLGVVGGELLVPALMLVFGADIRTAGTASLLISLEIVATGVWCCRRAGALPGAALGF